MEATKLNIGKFLEKQKTNFIIPIYQRNYSWDKSNCEQLFNDTDELRDKHTHFIGSIVYLNQKVSDYGLNEFLIIDGQQRLTTITIFLIALYRLFKERNYSKCEDIKYEYLVNKNDENNSENLKLFTNLENRKVLNYLLNDTKTVMTPNNLAKNNVYQNYQYFENILKSKSNNELMLLFNKFLKLEIVSISLQKDDDDPQKIFESLNSTGKDLTQSDLIRNFILMDLKEDQQKIIFKIWLEIEKNTTFTNNKKDDIKTSSFIRDFITLKTKVIPNENNVYVEYKKQYESKIKDYDNLESHILELHKFSKYYESLLNSKHEDKQIQEQIRDINKLKVGVSYPFILTILDNYKSEFLLKDHVIKILDTIQSFIFRRFIVNLATNRLNKIFLTLHDQTILKESPDKYIDHITKILLKNNNFPTDEIVKNALRDKDIYSRNKEKLKYLLLKLEPHNHKEILVEDNLEIEHIFPQTPSNDWKSIDKQDYDFLENKLHRLANLTLVPKANNSALANKSFTNKKNLRNNVGYKFSKLSLTRSLEDYNDWTQKAYENRFEELSTKFLEIWKIPDYKNKDNQKDFNETTNNNKTFTLAENTKTFKRTKIRQIKYKDSISNEHTTFKDFYRYIIKEIFLEYKNEIIANNKLQEKMLISTTKERYSVPCDEKYYVTTNNNLGSKNAIERLHTIFHELSIPLTSLEITIE